DLLRSGTQAAHVVVPVGQALAHIHAQRADRLPANSAEMQADHIESVAKQVSFLYPALSLQIKQTARRINYLLLEGSGVYKATHGDFYAKQILLDGDHVGILDFDESAFDDPMSDLGNFFAHLERDRLRYNLPEHLIQEYQEALLAGYSAAGQSINSRRVDLFYAANLFKLLPHPFRFREENWPAQTTLLLDKVQRVLVHAESSKIYLSSPINETKEGLPKRLKFNQDEALPFLKDALDPVAAVPAISRSIKTRYPDASIDKISRVHLRRHKVGRRCLIEYAIPLRNPLGKDELLHVLGKARRKKMDRATFDLTRTLWEDRFNTRSEDGMYVPEPLGIVPGYNMWLQRKIEGYTATHYLSGAVAAPLASNMAHVLHKLNTQGPAVERTHTLQDELGILEKRLAQVIASSPAWERRILEVLAACESLAQEIPHVHPQPIHRDFYPDNLLVADNGIYLLDLDLYCMGDPSLDAGNFIAHIMEYGLRKEGDPDAFVDSYQAFEDAFVALSGDQVRLPIHVYTTLALARHIQISTLFEDRRPFTEDILSLCEWRLASQAKSPLANSTNLVD
ncbi:MAG: phosphotransferase, partial [Rhodothermales bacterium]